MEEIDDVPTLEEIQHKVLMALCMTIIDVQQYQLECMGPVDHFDTDYERRAYLISRISELKRTVSKDIQEGNI